MTTTTTTTEATMHDNDDNVLMSRTSNGTTVELAYLPITDMCVLGVRRGDVMRARTVEHSEARDAFDHPALYIADADLLFSNTTTKEV